MSGGDLEATGEALRRIALELGSMGQTGLTYAHDRYDAARCRRMRELSAQLLAMLAGDVDPAAVHAALELDGGYATPHLDVRGGLFDDAGRVLLVREAVDERWTLPGGWADPLDPPTGAIEREFAEEAGLAVRAARIAFVHDGFLSNGHRRGGAPFHIWKIFFLCERQDTADPVAGIDGETTDVGFFALDALPPLSTGRTTRAQLRALARSHADPSIAVTAD